MNKPSPQPAWRTALKAIVLFLLVVLGILGLVLLVRAADSVVPVLPVIALALVLGAAWAGMRRVLWRRRDRPPSFAWAWLRAATVWALLLLALVAVPFLLANYINARRPLAMPRIVLTNGAKEVVFQGMVHVGSEPYYQGVVYDLTRAADEGYDLFFEGVRAGSEENQRLMGEILGTNGQDLNQFYDAFAQQCDLHFQNEYFDVYYDDIVTNPDQFINADVSVDDMIDEWRRLLEEHPEWRARQVNATPEDEVDDRLSGFMSGLENLSPGQRELVVLGCHTLMNVVFGEVGRGEKPPFKEHVVVEYRNRHLADMILQHPRDRIYVTYGYDHFRGVFRLLQEADPNWQITDVQWRQAVEDRPELERELLLEDGG